jgi:RecJ-like exonuclease
MLSFKALSEKKTKVTINPKLKDVMEKHGGKPCPKTGEAECKCDEKTPAQKSICPTCRGTGMVDGKTCPTCGGKKTKPMEEQAYVSQEEVSEESTEEVAETETLLTFGQFTEGKSLSIDDQMRISREHNRKSPEEKKAANKKAMGNVKKVAPKKDTRTDAQKMTDATGPRPGSRYRGD